MKGADIDIPARPNTMPLQQLKDSVSRQERWLLRQFPFTFNNKGYPLRVVQGAPYHIYLKKGAWPHACRIPAPVSKHWAMEVKRQLDDNVKRGVISPVSLGVATYWCTLMVVATKKSSKPCRTVDFQEMIYCCQ